jgi:precorrin-2 dehydrogenase/sirohydrochlorin ferrochelatase
MFGLPGPDGAAVASGYPVTLLVEGRPCLVVGGGPVAARKAAGLLAAGAGVDLVAPAVCEAVRALETSGLRVHQRAYVPPEASRYRLVVAATGRAEVDGQVFSDADTAGVWVNAADVPSSCSFYLPAVARRGPVSVAVSTDGTSPALASWLRARLEAELGPEVEVLAGLLGEERRAMQRRGEATEGANWRRALDSDMLELIRDGRLDLARERLRACL